MNKTMVMFLIICCFFVSSMFCLQSALAAIDVDMALNDGGFVSFDHFIAELRLNNHDAIVPDAQIFGVLDVYGSFFFWPNFSMDVNFQTRDIAEGEMTVTFLEFDFPDIDAFIPFGPMNFWGAWIVSGDQYGYDVQEFWLDSEHKWTPTPAASPGTPTFTPTTAPGSPTHTPILQHSRQLLAATRQPRPRRRDIGRMRVRIYLKQPICVMFRPLMRKSGLQEEPIRYFTVPKMPISGR